MALTIFVLLILLLIASIASGFAGIFLPILLVVAIGIFAVYGLKKGVWR
jgi:hypothetical protein